MGASGEREIEIKLRVGDAAAMRRRLAKRGAHAAKTGRVRELNTLYDTPQGGLARQGQLVRIRTVERPGATRRATKALGPSAWLTFKGPSENVVPRGGAPGGKYKVREEIEVALADPARMGAILEALGLRGWFRYEKYRTRHELSPRLRWASGLEVMLDETPIGAFLELEGPPEAIDRMAALLGYKPADYITKSYLALYLDECRKQGKTPANMLFGPRDPAARE